MLETLKEGLYFDTVKLVTVRNLKLGMLHRTMQFAVLCYVCIFAIWYKQGYQDTSEISGVIYTKVKGISSSGDFTFDAGDLVVPASENSAVFIATRQLNTVQKPDICPDDSDPLSNNCTTNADCKEGAKTSNGWVVKDQCDLATHKCNVSAWCPVENEGKYPFTVFEDVADFTVFIRSEVVYDKWQIGYSNAAKVTPGLNLFSVGEILAGANMSDVMKNGVIVNIQLDWSCDLNEAPKQGGCTPKLIFKRISDSADAASHGYNFRRTVYFNNNITVNPDVGDPFTARVLSKIYGVRLILNIKGLGRKFDVFQLAITLGSGIAFFAVATVATDIILQYCHPKKDKFKKAKHNDLRFDDDEQSVLVEPGSSINNERYSEQQTTNPLMTSQ